MLLIPIPALLARRCHASGRSGWWAALPLPFWTFERLRAEIAFARGPEARLAVEAWLWWIDWLAIPAILLMLALLLVPGTSGPNRFGPDPRG